MKTLLIFLWIYLAMMAMAFWESEIEGRKAWDEGKLGWKIRLGRYCLPAYHLFLFWVMWPLLLSLPLVIYGWDKQLFGILLSAYFSGVVFEDFLWYVVNPAIKLKDSFNPQFANHYPWLKFGKLAIPTLYPVGEVTSFLSWFFLWR